ncbi:MAG: tetratricopeptide repeat protein [Halarcobacter sp.]
MKKYFKLIAIIIFLFNNLLYADKQEEKKLYDKAMELIDDYSGNSTNLYEALYQIEKIKKINSNSKYYFISKGRYLRIKGYLYGDTYEDEALEKSKSFIKKAIKIEPSYIDSYFYGIPTYIYGNDIVSAKDFIKKTEKLVKSEKDRGKLLYMKTQLDLKLKKFDLVIENSNKILKLDIPEKFYYGVYSNLAQAYKNIKEYDKAESYYKKVIELKSSAWNIFNLGSFYYNYKKEYDKAIKYCKEAISIMNFPLANKVLGKAYYKKAAKLYWDEKWYQDALENFLLSVQYYPTSNGYYGLGLSYYQVGHGTKNKDLILKAKEAFEYSLELNPDNKYSKKYLFRVNELLTWIEQNQ